MILVSCEKDETIVDLIQEEVAPDYESISSARDWFYAHTGGDVILEEQSQTKSTSNSTVQHPLLGDWESGLTSSVGIIQNVEVPVYSVDNEASYAEAINGTGNLKSGKTGKNEENLPSRTRFVIQTDEETGSTRGFMMTVIPDEEYLAAGGSIDSIDYYNRGTDFSGLIVFNHLDGSFANAWEYEDGKTLQGYIPQREQGSGTSSLKAFAQIEYLICTDTYLTFKGNTSYVRSNCWYSTETIWYYEDYYSSQRDYELSNFEEREYSGGSGGSSSGSSAGKGEYLPYEPETECPLSNSIIRKNNLNPTQAFLLEDALDELILEHCFQESVYDNLVSNGMKINFDIKKSNGSPAFYDPSNKTIYFRDNASINSEAVKEELFHVFQDCYYSGGILQYGTTGKVNIEFEAKLFKDIAKSSLDVCCYAFRLTGIIPSNVIDDYRDWVYSIRDNPKKLTDAMYQKFLKLYNTYDPEYSSPTSPTLNKPSAIREILQNSECVK